jgi:hypothetical protein
LFLCFCVGSFSCTVCHSVFTPECENEELPSLTDNYPSMPEITVTAKGTEKLLSKLDPSKATGPDEISSLILKQYAHEFAPLLTTIFNTLMLVSH